MTKKTIGIIGMGSIGKRHANNLTALGHNVIGYDTDPKLNQSIHFADNLDAMIEYVDAVVIASPTNTHLDYIIKAIEAGKPFFVEKPITDCVVTDHLANAITMVGYNLRFHQCVLRAEEWIKEGYIGDPIWANFVVAQKNDKYTDSVILNWSHEIDLALHLLGPANLINYAIGVDPVSMRQKIADLHLFHSNGCRSTVHLDYLTEPEIRQSIIVGKDATIIMDLVHRHAWLRSRTTLDHCEATDNWDQNYLDEIETFLARCDGVETIGCTGAEGLEVLKICLATRKPLPSP
jgi:predicted dehydrogenase